MHFPSQMKMQQHKKVTLLKLITQQRGTTATLASCWERPEHPKAQENLVGRKEPAPPHRAAGVRAWTMPSPGPNAAREALGNLTSAAQWASGDCSPRAHNGAWR